MKNKRFSFYPPFYPDITLTGAEGVYVFDGNKKYIDLSGSAGMAIVGYGYKKIKELIKRQAEKLIISPQKYRTVEAKKLAEKILNLFPEIYDTVMPAVTGSEAVEIAMQAAINHTGKKKFLSFRVAYHGHTFGSGSLGEGDYNFGVGGALFETIDVPGTADKNDGIIMNLKERLGRKEYAAVVVEGVVTNAGYVMPPSSFYRQLSELCREHGVLLIFDEVLTGFGRTGKMFSFEHHGLKPDMICLAKGLSSGYAAIAAVVASEKLVRGYDYMSTFAWSPLSCAIAATNIDIILKEKLTENSRILGRCGLEFLRKNLADCRSIKAIRGVGLGMVLELISGDDVARVYRRCLDSGVIVFKNPYANLIFIQPPLIIKKEELLGALKKLIVVVKQLC